MTLSDPGAPGAEASAPPVSRPVAPPPGDDTPAYGIPVPPVHQPWPAGPADTVGLPTVPPEPAPPRDGQALGTPDEWTGGGGGGGGGPEKQSGAVARRLMPLLLGAAAVIALGGTAMALWTMPDSSGDGGTRLDAKPSTPVAAMAPTEPSPSPSAASRSPSPSVSRSPSPSASRSASPSASPSPSRSASPTASSPSPSPSTSRSPSPKPPPPAQAATLRYGDSGAEVEKLQHLLAGQGLYRGRFNGQFDWRVEQAVSKFQFDRGIDDEEWGVYGPVTRRALEG
ncbi:peptidoglycan-binding protein [Streptomyces sp. NPDC058674]|uniref:peptidoglycan-binding domain-containing protein n=1 Tax=Streptomyces sp. NPDC058674 TaxID=3346592 RepID=UPI00365F777A